MVSAADVKARAAGFGFDLCGVAPATGLPELAFLPDWLRRGYAGRMTYLNRTARKRADACAWMPSARSVVAVACLYNTARPYSADIADTGRALIARYAWGDDYHDVMGARLQAFARWMAEQGGAGTEVKWCVDDGPAQERVYAHHAGLGWIGHNTCVINPDLGSWILLGVVATNLDLAADTPLPDGCGTCRLCIEACPTGAIVEPHVLDATRCLSYLTIEVRGEIPEGQRASLGHHVFGCDICQDVCPYNASAPHSAKPEWQPKPALDAPALADLAGLSDAGLEAAVAGTALRRAGLAGLRRNLAIALANR
jgi:epoxyqueuosine reductase